MQMDLQAHEDLAGAGGGSVERLDLGGHCAGGIVDGGFVGGGDVEGLGSCCCCFGHFELRGVKAPRSWGCGLLGGGKGCMIRVGRVFFNSLVG